MLLMLPAETSLLLLRVARAWALPGLGLLVLPDGPAPPLTAYDLHTALAVAIHLPDGRHQPGHATVEEVSRPDDGASGPTRGLLLDLQSVRELPIGTTIWLAPASPAAA